MTKLLPFVFLAFVACETTRGTRRVPVDSDDPNMGTGLESADIVSVEKFAVQILAAPELTGPAVEGTPTIAIHPVENNTDQEIDGELLVRRIRTALVQRAEGRVAFVVRNRNEAVIERERIAKREGEYTSTRQEMKLGADYILTGTAASISSASKHGESRAIWIDFELIDAENGKIVWAGKYETKKVGKNSVIYR